MCLIDIILIVLFPVEKSFIVKSIVEVLNDPLSKSSEGRAAELEYLTDNVFAQAHTHCSH